MRFLFRVVAILSFYTMLLGSVSACDYSNQSLDLYSQHDACKQTVKGVANTQNSSREGGNWSGYNTASDNPPSTYNEGDWSVCATWKLSIDTCTNPKATDGRWVGLEGGNDNKQTLTTPLVQVFTLFNCSVTPKRWQYCFQVVPDMNGVVCYDDPDLQKPQVEVTGWITYHQGNYEAEIFHHRFYKNGFTAPQFADIMLEAMGLGVKKNTAQVSWLAAFQDVTFTNCLVNGMPFFKAPSIVHDVQIYTDQRTGATGFNTSEKVLSDRSFRVHFLSA